MTRGLLVLQRLTITRRTTRHVSFASIIRKKPVKSLIEKKLTANQGTASILKKSDPIGRPNLNTRDLSYIDRMGKIECSANNDHQIEYLETPVKSENDKKEYRVIRLQNGLTALLIADLHSTSASELQKPWLADSSTSEDESEDDESEGKEDDDDDDDEDEDEDEDEENEESESNQCDEGDSDKAAKTVKREERMAACGLCVGVGSFSDPPEIPGMAHFLEHMVFMGSEKYRPENDFDEYIIKRCGSDNASTECEQTTFYFDIHKKHLYQALDRFAQFFIKPLMKRNAITREREAIESEFQLALPSDQYRKEQLFCSFARPNHPAKKFSWGNLVTLRDNVNDDKLYEELHKFRERHYSAHRMKLAIQASLPLDTLEKYVSMCFADVPNNGLPPDDFTEFKGANSFNTPNFRRMYKIKPIKDICQIELTWAMPPLHDLYKSKPHQYVSWIIGHEGKGSLISYLREKMWCLGIFSGNGESGFEHSSMYALFNLSLVLTEEGYEHLDEVLNAIFSFINLMKREGPQKRIYDEIHQIDETNFRFTDEERPTNYVENLCENMHFYPPSDYITGSELYFEYNPEAIQDCMNLLSPENVNIIIFDKKFNDNEFEKIEPWFKTKYTDIEIPQEWIERWKTIEPLPDFHLPLPNPFLVNDFSLMSLQENIPKYPIKIHSDSVSEIWYRPDSTFRLPECYMNFHFISPLLHMSPKNAALTDLFVGILKQLLVKELYPATAADFNHQISTSEKGIIVKVDGFNEKIALLLMTIVRYIADYLNLVTKELFEVMKEQQIKEYYNTFLKPEKLEKDARLSILMLVHWTCVDRHAAICSIDFDQFKNFVKSFTDHLYIQCLVQGNMTKSAVIENVQQCIQILKCGSLLPNTMPQIRIAEIPVGTHYCKLKNFNKTDVNSVVTNYYQAGMDSIKLSVMIDLFMLLIEQPLFHRLRTEEQLGYNVFCLLRDTFGILGYSVTVHTQADKYTTDYIDERIEAFFKSFMKAFENNTEEELDRLKDSLMKMKQCADIHLKEEVSRNWIEITTRDYMFDRIEREVLAIKEIKCDTLSEWIKKHILSGSNFRKLSIHIVGTVPEKTESTKYSKKDDDLDHTEESNAVEDNAKAKYSFEYVTNDQQSEKDNHIIDIEDYKQHLYVYPINRIGL